MNAYLQKRKQILQQMEQISQMELGSLHEERRPSKRHPGQLQGPYYKLQAWADGRNQSRRVPPDKAPALAQAIAGRQQFEKLAQDFIDTTVAMTREQTSPNAKKNTTTSKPRSKPKHRDTSTGS
jgi:DNA-binding transcriptional regulator YdaS (Cro superfamily)